MKNHSMELWSILATLAMVLSGGVVEAAPIDSNVSVYSSSTPLYVSGGAYGNRGPGGVGSYFNWEHLGSVGVGKGATVGGGSGGGGSGSSNPDLYFSFGLGGAFERLSENQGPENYISNGWDPSGNYGSRTGFDINEDQMYITYDNDGNIVEFILNNEFRLTGSAEMYMYAYLDKEDLGWHIATSMYAQANLQNIDGARILSFQPIASSFSFNGYEGSKVYFEGRGVIPGDAYTITAINGVTVPEPATAGMLGIGALVCGGRFLRRRRERNMIA